MLAALVDVHEGWAWVVIGSNALAGAWALCADRVVRLRSPWLWRFTALAQLSIMVQVLLGVALYADDEHAGDRLHMFYGYVALFSVTLLYAYRTSLRDRLHLLYGLGGLFLMGLAIRALLLA